MTNIIFFHIKLEARLRHLIKGCQIVPSIRQGYPTGVCVDGYVSGNDNGSYVLYVL